MKGLHVDKHLEAGIELDFGLALEIPNTETA